MDKWGQKHCEILPISFLFELMWLEQATSKNYAKDTNGFPA